MKIAVAKETVKGGGLSAPADDLHRVICQYGAKIDPNTITVDDNVEIDQEEPDEEPVVFGANITLPCAHYIAAQDKGSGLLWENMFGGQWGETKVANVMATLEGNKIKVAAGGLGGFKGEAALFVFGGSFAGWYVIEADSTNDEIPLLPYLGTSYADELAAQNVSIISRPLIPGSYDDTLILEGEHKTGNFHRGLGTRIKSMALGVSGNAVVKNDFTAVSMLFERGLASASDHEPLDPGFTHAQINRTGESVFYLREKGNLAYRFSLQKWDLTIDNGAALGEPDIDGLVEIEGPSYISVKGSASGKYDGAIEEGFFDRSKRFEGTLVEKNRLGEYSITRFPSIALTGYTAEDPKEKRTTMVNFNFQCRKGTGPKIVKTYMPAAYPA